MINNTQPVQHALVHPLAGHAAKAHLHQGAKSVGRAQEIESARPSSPEARLGANLGTEAVQNSTAAAEPLADEAQAVQATQHARALIQAQAQTALRAQANASSQSVERLLS